MQSGEIKEIQLAASSFRSNRYRPNHGRLHFNRTRGARGAWKAALNFIGQWFQIYLGNEYTWVTGIATQGREDDDRWVKTYLLLYWGWGVRFQWYKEKGQRFFKVKKKKTILQLCHIFVI